MHDDREQTDTCEDLPDVDAVAFYESFFGDLEALAVQLEAEDAQLQQDEDKR